MILVFILFKFPSTVLAFLAFHRGSAENPRRSYADGPTNRPRLGTPSVLAVLDADKIFRSTAQLWFEITVRHEHR